MYQWRTLYHLAKILSTDYGLSHSKGLSINAINSNYDCLSRSKLLLLLIFYWQFEPCKAKEDWKIKYLNNSNVFSSFQCAST